MLGGDDNDAGLLASMGIPQDKWDQMRGEAVTDIWPENWAALEVFSALQTQWRVGMAGPTGLDYAGVRAVMDLQAIPSDAHPALFQDLQALEREHLAVSAERAAKERAAIAAARPRPGR